MIRVRFDRDCYHRNSEIVEWAEERFGPFKYYVGEEELGDTPRWKFASMFGMSDYYFKHDEDSMMFILKWGGLASNVQPWDTTWTSA